MFAIERYQSMLKQHSVQTYDQFEGLKREREDNAAFRLMPESVPRLGDKEKPMGRLSDVKAGNMIFQVQTEFVSYPEDQIVTIVMLDGKVVTKRTRQSPSGRVDRTDLAKMIDELHVSVEKEVHGKISDLMAKKTGHEETIRQKVGRLFEEGFEKCKEHNYEAALAAWLEACTLDPLNKVLAANIRILRNKLNLAYDPYRLSPN